MRSSTTPDFGFRLLRKIPVGLDIVFDCAGGKALEEKADLLRRQSRLVSIMEHPGSQESGAAHLKAGFVFVSPNSVQLKRIAENHRFRQGTPTTDD
ncbi:MAG: hypothetical protein R3B54_00215 [Bdellovibrionota bacterium]